MKLNKENLRKKLPDLTSAIEPTATYVGKLVSGKTSNPRMLRFVHFAAAKAWEAENLEEAERLYLSIPAGQRSSEVIVRLRSIAKQLRDEDFSDQLFQEFDRESSTATDAYKMLELARDKNDSAHISEFQELVASKVQKQGGYTVELFRALHTKDPLWRQYEVLKSNQPSAKDLRDWKELEARTAWRLNHFDQAQETIEQYLKESGISADVWYLYGEAKRQEGDTSGAKEAFAKATHLLRGKEKNLGVVPLARKHSSDLVALEIIDGGLSQIASTDVLTQVRAEILERLSRFVEATSEYAILSGKKFKDARLSYKLGLNAERSGDFELAETAYRNALRQSKNVNGKWFSYRLAVVLAQLGNPIEAFEYFLAYFDSSEDFEASRERLDYAYKIRSAKLAKSFRSLGDFAADRIVQWQSSSTELLRLKNLLKRGDVQNRLELAKLLADYELYEDACEVLSAAEVFGSKDGLNPDSFRKSTYGKRTTFYSETIATIPVNDKLILWESNHGSSVGCHPLAMFRELVGNHEYSDYVHVWAVNDLSTVPQDVIDNPDVILVKVHSDDYLHVLATAKYLVNNVSFPPYFYRREDQRYLNTWHGTPLKTLGKSMRQGILEHENLQRNFIQATTIMAPNELTRWSLIEDHDIDDVYRGTAIVAGSPRLDTSINLTDKDRTRIRSAMGLSNSDRVLLYAPTWRGGVSAHELDTEALLADLEALNSVEGVKVVYRAHRLSEKLLQGIDIPVTVVPRHIDTNELLGAVDILVSDYSSILFDFIPQAKPIIKYVHDLEEYTAQRGLYLSLHEVPGLEAADRSELTAMVQKASKGLGKPEPEHIERFCPFEDGKAAERVNRYFFDNESSSIGKYFDYSDQSADGRQSVLLHACLMPNGIASACLSLLEKLDSDKYVVNLIVEPETLRKNLDRHEQFLKVPKNVRVICRTVNLVRTVAQIDLVGRFSKLGEFPSESFRQSYFEAFDNERRRILGEYVPDLVIEYDGYAEFWLSLMSRWRRGDAIASCYQHNQMFQEFAEKYPELKATFSLYPEFDRIVAVSPSLAEHNANDLRRLVPEIDALQASARNLVDSATIRRKAGETNDYEDQIQWMNRFNNCFVTVGRMSTEKNQMALLNAVAKLRKSGLDIGLVLVGSGVLEGELRAKAESLGMNDYVLFTGQVPNPYPFIAHASAFVLPSKHEGQPVTLLEAMVLGVPVIASRLPGCEEIIELGYGCLTGTDSSEIESTLREFIDDRDIASGFFDASQYESDTIKQIISVLSGS